MSTLDPSESEDKLNFVNTQENATPSESAEILEGQNSSLISNNTADGSSPESMRANVNEAEDDSDSRNENSKRKGSKGKPSSALIQAKLNAKKRMKGTASSPDTGPVIIKDHLQPARDAKDWIRKETGIIYDIRMLEHQSLWDPGHPECPARFSSIIKRCIELDLLERCVSIPPRFATISEVLSLHTLEHIEKLREITEIEDVVKLEDIASEYDAVYFHPSTYELALLACGSTIDLIRNIVEGKIHNGMAIIRPPGHHAMKEEYCGYCYFNNVAIAAKQILATNSSIKKILIVDFDVHHGQATQQMFYDDSRVLYFSTHRYEHGMYWPNLEESNYNWVGADAGIGFNCNIPLNSIGLGNADFLSVWQKILIPMAYQFNPDLVIVSAGYDAALGCPEGRMRVTPQCYPHLLWPLMGLANGKVAVILEGGYCLKSLAEGAALTLRSLLGDPCPLIQPIMNPSSFIVDTIMNATTALKDYWSFGAIRTATGAEYDESVLTGEGHKLSYRFDWTEPKPLKYPTRSAFVLNEKEVFLALDKELDQLNLTTSLSVAKHRVGLLYDDVMLMHRNTTVVHPESPERISNIFACHASFGLVERCHRIASRKATHEELRLVHAEEHILKMRNSERLGRKDLGNLEDRYNSIFLNNHSYESALYAAGSLLNVVESVLTGECQSGVAIVRPPGHHAEEDEACGFCLFNNVALAAKYGIENHDLKRILIVDWDVHHGNGIQHMFDSDPRVLYISLHRYDYGSFFPSKKDANFDYVGNGAGEGFTVNIPWNKKGMGDTEYLTAFTNVIMPIAYEYAPELVLVSAGFDAAQGDPLGGCKISPEGYGHMTHLLTSMANGKVILALEGGYNLTAISYSMSLCTKALLGDPLPKLCLRDVADESALESIRDVLQTHSAYWTLLKPFQKILPSEFPIQQGKYSIIPTKENEIVELMEKLKVGPELVDVNANPELTIPDPPISAGGEPSLSIPTIPPTVNIQRNQRRQVQIEDDMSIGGGELAIGTVNIEETTEEEVIAAGGEEPLEGAVGGSNTQQEFSIQVFVEDDNNMFAVYPLNWCPHLSSVNSVPTTGIDITTPCNDCHSTQENWICLICYVVKCSRYIREHMLMHCVETGHSMALSFSDLSIWCFPCESYVDNQALQEAKAAAYMNKFGDSYTPSNNAN